MAHVDERPTEDPELAVLLKAAFEELVRGTRGVWHGKVQRVRLGPELPYAIWRVRPEDRSWT